MKVDMLDEIDDVGDFLIRLSTILIPWLLCIMRIRQEGF